MNNRLTAHQACMLLYISIIASKFQRLSAVLSQPFSRDIWLVALFYLAIDLGLTALTIFIASKFNGQTLFDFISSRFGRVAMLFVALVFSVYFYFKIGASYKGVHEFFANTLFDKLSWSYFSIILLLLLVFLTTNGLNVIGRSCEFYGLLIGVCIVVAMGLGLKSCDFGRLLPILDIDFSTVLPKGVKFVPWFANYMIIFLFAGNLEMDKKCKKNLFLTYLISGLLVVTVYVLFVAINGSLSVFQNNALSSITQNSLIGLGIGRPDWFLVLITMIGNFLSTALYFFGIVYCFCKAFGIKYCYLSVVVGAVLLYISDIVLFPNLDASENLLLNYSSYYMLVFNILLPIICLIALAFKQKHTKSGYRARCEI